MSFFRRFVPALALLTAAHATEQAGPAHPLDGLTAPEYQAVIDVLTEAGRVDESSQFALVNLSEPDKQAVLDWKPGDNFDRRAFVAVRHERKLFESVVNIGTRDIERWHAVETGQVQLLDSEFMLAQLIVRKNDAFRAAIGKRGIDDPKKVFCFPVFPGYFDTGLDRDERRLGMVGCFESGSDRGLWGRPIGGLTAIIDYDERALVELIDSGPVPIPAGGPAVADDQPDELPPAGPAEPRFSIEGSRISWDRWNFHLRLDPRVGPVLSDVKVRDGDDWRSVMYQGSVSELFVPYMDPTEHWYFRAYLDVGEYGIGSSGVPLIAGKDCPPNAAMISADMLTDSGRIQTKKNLACVFERYTGDAAWSHFEIAKGGSQQRRHTELVVRFIVWLGNYDYVLDWIFTETGELKGRVGATGIVQVKAVGSQHMDDETAAADTAYGRLIRPGTVAINHDHFFSFRLDLDVDGSANSLMIDRVRQVRVEDTDVATPRRQIWQVFSTPAQTESEAKLNADPLKPALWRVASTAGRNAVGNPTSYQLHPGIPARTLLDDDEFAHRRAAFTAYNLWVTPYRAAERYAAGNWPNRHPGGAGLPAWTADNREIANTDIVLWYTIGMHHVVRAEDWPIMPTVQSEFVLRPFDFFDHNPTAAD